MTDSYMTPALATAYLALQLNASAWDLATADNQAAALRRATALIDAQSFRGVLASPTQPQAWPRRGVVDDEGRRYPSTEVPEAVQQACAEWACSLLTSTPTAHAQNVTRKRVGDLEIEYAPAMADALPTMVRTLLTPFLNHGINTARLNPC